MDTYRRQVQLFYYFINRDGTYVQRILLPTRLETLGCRFIHNQQLPRTEACLPGERKKVRIH